MDIAVPEVFVGGLLGAMLVFLFSSWSFAAVGRTAQVTEPPPAACSWQKQNILFIYFFIYFVLIFFIFLFCFKCKGMAVPTP